uniref:Uncharacterized protein n=1 Tax=Syphacia muris TaxID=451379 RepID=A0A158R580_9BILA
MDRKNRREFIKCLQRIKKDLDIQAGARCITAALDNRLIRKKSFRTSFIQLQWQNFLLVLPINRYLFKGMQKSPLMGKLFNILDSFAKHNGDDNFKILSPRFLPVIPDKKKIRHALSPNLFPMYNDDSPNSILPIPKMLKATGMSDSDRDAVIELIMQASGARNMIDKTIESMDRIEKFGLADDITNITVFIRNMFTKLEKTFNSRQKREIKSRHYTFLTKEQLLSLFGPEGPYNNTKFPFSIEEYGTWSEEDKKNALFNRIRALAGETVDDPARGSRRKRQVTLSPFAFSPSVLGVSVLAPVTLSPNIFSPSILNPYILSPPVLSPQIADPMIISPYILGPNTLSAAIMNVYVLTPYVLSPNVMNPYIMSPLILSPYILSPDLLSPTILCGGIISPAVMSPSVLSPSAFAADILSPSILS